MCPAITSSVIQGCPNEDVGAIGDGSRIGQGDECVGDGEADGDRLALATTARLVSAST
jgi:hypothetical protein